MDELNVHIVELAPGRVASVLGYGSQPENQAWEKLVAWAGPQGFLQSRQQHRIFGFNNPNPSEGSPNYGYEFWMLVGPEQQSAGEVEIKDFPGGLYAVARCQVKGDAYQSIPITWQALVQWCEDSPYRMSSQQCLEEVIENEMLAEGEFTLDLYLPIEE
jgi:DNA gyrase inhibitor GyrI